MEIIEVNLADLDLRYAKLRARSPAAEKKLLVSLGETGQQSPVIVVRGKDGCYVVIDGHKRVRALRKLKADIVKASVWDLGEEDALTAHYRMSRQGGLSAVEEGWLVAELHRTRRWDLRRIAERLLKSRSWVSRRLSLAEELPECIGGAVGRGEIGAHAAMNSLVPLTRGNRGDGKALVEKICGLGLTSRQIKELCAAFRASGSAVRQRMVADPALFLRARAAVGKPERDFTDQESRCAKNLDLVGKVALGLARDLPQVLGNEDGSRARGKLMAVWGRCRDRLSLLVRTVTALFKEESECLNRKEATADAGQRDTDDDTESPPPGAWPARDRASAQDQPEQRQGGHQKRASGVPAGVACQPPV